MRRVVDRRRAARSAGNEAALRIAACPARRDREPRSGDEIEGRSGCSEPRGLARAARRALLPRGPRGSGGGERKGHRAGRSEELDLQRRAGRDGSGGRQGAVDSLDSVGNKSSRSRKPADRCGVGSGLVIRFDVVTLFPEMFGAITASGITSRALQAGLWSLKTWNPRDFTSDN